MTRRPFVVTTLITLLAAASAAASDVSYDLDRSAPFASYRTYAWAPGTPIGDPINDARITAAIDVQLAGKGLTIAVAAAVPDLRVAYRVTFGQSVRISGSSSGFGPYGLGASRIGSARADAVLVGTLSVEITAGATGRIVWRGITSVDVDQRATPEKREKAITKAVARLLKSVPAAAAR